MYTVIHSKLSPITTLLNCSGVIPHRVVLYRKVRAINCVGSALGWQYGIVTINNTKRIVKRHCVNGVWQQWSIVL